MGSGKVSKAIMRLMGWKTQPLPKDMELPAKCIVLADPHTSLCDIPLFLLTRKAIRLPCRFIAARNLFFFPLGGFLRCMGGMSINRKGGLSNVAALTEMMKEADELVLVMSPSGFLKYLDHWKSGFYYLALQADVPVLCAFVDYKTKTAGLVPLVVHLTGDPQTDMDTFREAYRGIEGLWPKLQNKVYLKAEDQSETANNISGAAAPDSQTPDNAKQSGGIKSTRCGSSQQKNKSYGRNAIVPLSIKV